MNIKAHILSPDTTPSSLIKQMNEVTSGLLRGSQAPKDRIDSAQKILSHVEELLSSELGLIEKMQESYKKRDKETFGKLMMSLIGNYEDIKELAQKTNEISPELALALSDDLALPLSVEDFSESALLTERMFDLFDENVFADLAETIFGVKPFIDQSILALQNVEHDRRLMSENDPDIDASDFDFGYTQDSGTRHDDDLFSNVRSKSHHHKDRREFSPHDFYDSQTMKQMSERPKRGLVFPDLKVARELRAKYGDVSGNGRRRLQQTNRCEACPEEDYQCNCRTLVRCAKDLKLYDLAVLLLGGYVSIEYQCNLVCMC